MIKPTSGNWTGQGLSVKRPRKGGTTPGAIDYSEELALEILEWVCEKSLRSFCQEPDGTRIPGRPTMQAVFKWRANIPAFNVAYFDAMRDRAHMFVDQIVEIADTEDDVKKARNMIDARKWAASRYLPKVYGDRVAVTGEKDGDPIKFEGSAKPSDMTDAELLAIAAKGQTTKT